MTTAQINTINRNKSAQLNFIYVDTTNHQYPIYYIGLQDGTLKQQTTTSASIGAITPLSIVSLSPLFTASVNTTSTSQDIIFAQIPQAANTFYGGPTSGLDANPTFRILTTADLPAGTGTVTNFSAGNLSPLFTTSVATPTTTPVLSFTLNTQTANTIFAGPTTGAAATPTFRSLVAADISGIAWLLNGNTVGSEKYIGTNDAFSLPFRINGGETGRFLYSATASINGNFGVNTTSPTAKIHIKGYDGTSSNYGLKVDNSTPTTNFYVRNDGAVNSKLGYWIEDNKVFHLGFSGIGGTSTFIGYNSGLTESASGNGNASCGRSALASITDGIRCTAIGYNALSSITVNGNSVAIGWEALRNDTGGENIGIGSSAAPNLTGTRNTVIGQQSGNTMVAAIRNTLIGAYTEVTSATQAYSIALGAHAIITADSQWVVGSAAAPINDAYFGQGVSQPSVIPDLSFNVTSVTAGQTDTNAGNWYFKGGKGTGTGTGSDFIFQIAPPGSTGNTQNSLVTAFKIINSKSVIVGSSALTTTATDGFLYVPSCAGVPTGVPTAQTGTIPIVVDSTNNKMYIYSGGAWVALN